MVIFYFGHESSSWVELRLHTENQLPRCPGYGLILVGVIVWYHCYYCYGGNKKTTNLSWVIVELGWVGLEFDNIDTLINNSVIEPTKSTDHEERPDEIVASCE